jgi:hypothetical protein
LHVSGFRCTVWATELGWWLSSTVITPGPKEGMIMEFLVVAIVAIVGFGLYRFMRTRTAH